MHSHPFNAKSPCICNAICHCMLYHVTCIMNATWTTQSTLLTRCHGQSHHLHMTFIYHFLHVNISYNHISTFTCNMSFYVQVMTHTQSSHVMAIAHTNSSHVNTFGVLILTSKQVTTLSSSETLIIKPCHGHLHI